MSEPAEEDAAIERVVSKTKSASASLRTVRVRSRSSTGWAAPIETKTANAAIAAT